MATAQSTNDLTRQQLDELDALLQKMLALPLSTPEIAASTSSVAATSRSIVPEAPLPDVLLPRSTTLPSYSPPNPRQNGRETAPQEVWRGDSPSSPAPTPQLLALQIPSTPPPATVIRKAPSSQRMVERGTQPAPLVEKVEMPSELVSNPFLIGRPILPISDTAQAPPAPSQSEPPMMEYVPPVLVPLVAFNRALNTGLERLGMAGRILGSGFGKNLLALAGLGLLAFTAAKIAQLLGWVTLSTALPWPT
jgi:hypothetical protein